MGSLTASSWVTLSLLLVIVIIALQTDPCVAKRGCSAFGHSCFGGHGKRSEDEALSQSDVEQGFALQQDEIPAASQLQSRLSLSPFLRQWLQSYRRTTGELDEK